MALRQSHKRYLAVLGVAMAALVVDQLFLQGPQSADAASEPSSATPPAITPHAEAGPEDAFPDLQRVTDELDTLATRHQLDPTDVRDVFSMPAHWAPIVVVETDTSDRGADFAASYELSAVLINERGSMVVIDGRLIGIGDTIESYTLVEVKPRSARFSSSRGDVVLVLRQGQ